MIFNIQSVIFFMSGTHFRTNHGQVQDLNEMRNIKTGNLYIRLMLTSRLCLTFKTFRIISLCSFKFHQEVPGIRKSL